MAEGGTLGGDVGFVLGGGTTNGATLGQTPYIARRKELKGRSRERTELTGTFE